MARPWLESYKAYLVHHDTPREEVNTSLHNAMRQIDGLPHNVREAVIKELNSWGRDDFCIFNGYLAALDTVQKVLWPLQHARSHT